MNQEELKQALEQIYRAGTRKADREKARAIAEKIVMYWGAMEILAGENVIVSVANANHAAVKESAELRDALKEIATLDYENADCWTGRSAIEMARTALRIKRV